MRSNSDNRSVFIIIIMINRDLVRLVRVVTSDQAISSYDCDWSQARLKKESKKLSWLSATTIRNSFG